MSLHAVQLRLCTAARIFWEPTFALEYHCCCERDATLPTIYINNWILKLKRNNDECVLYVLSIANFAAVDSGPTVVVTLHCSRPA